TIPPNAPTGNNSGMYWSWGSMYRFALFEGHFDTIPGNMGQLPFNFSIHTGFDTCYRERSIPINLQPGAVDTMRLNLLVDISRFFTNGTDTLDLTQGASWHGEVNDIGEVINIDLALKMANLQIASFSVQ
ncbi:MAG: MbnP family protein, partial [Flavobacteriales bacterium]